MNRVIQRAVLAASMCGVNMMASSAELSSPAQIIVRYGDLDLSRVEGLSRLQARIENAAERVCAAFDSRVPDRHARFVECKRTAVDEAVNRVALPALATRYASR